MVKTNVKDLSELSNMTKGLTRTIEIILDSEDELGRLLHPDYEKPFRTIIGNVCCSGNAMRFLTHTDFKVNWLNKKLNYKNFRSLKTMAHRDVPNYWEIVTLIITDRILSDKQLINKLVLEFKQHTKNGGKYFKFVPMVKQERGVLGTSKVPNNKLFTYGKILDRIIPIIYTTYINVDEDILTMSKSKSREAKDLVKTTVWNEVIRNSKGNVLSTIAPTSNEDLRKMFFK